MTREIRLYVEGGGNDKASRIKLKHGLVAFFATLCEKARANGIEVRPEPFGSRSAAYKAFCTAVRKQPELFNVLLVDSEDRVDGGSPWRHLLKRREDQWANPGVSDEHCHLMIQAMEAWLVADCEKLAEYYGQGFQASAIPNPRSVEEIDKSRLADALNRATRKTKKRRYHKIRHAPEILGRIRADVVRKRAPSCDRLFITLLAVIKAA